MGLVNSFKGHQLFNGNNIKGCTNCSHDVQDLRDNWNENISHT